MGLPRWLSGKESFCDAGDSGSIPGSGPSLGEGTRYPLQYFCLENPMDRGAWQATVHGVTKSWTRLSNWTTTATVPVWLCGDKKTPLLSVEEELMDAWCLLKNEEQCGLRPYLFLWLKNCSPLSSPGGTPFPPHLDFWEVSVTNKTLETPLDYKEIQAVHPKGNQSWIFTGRTDVEGETPILWPPDAKNWLTWKDPDAGKDWGQEKKGTTEDEMVGWHHRRNGLEFKQALGVGDG